ncbi:MAG TPA: hypothetical protein PLO53_07280 [Candidatus Hydrogenedentes bacterium]|nr:hypothetical protein [Candidatus Hydrogenedentota bacterium]
MSSSLWSLYGPEDDTGEEPNEAMIARWVLEHMRSIASEEAGPDERRFIVRAMHLVEQGRIQQAISLLENALESHITYLMKHRDDGGGNPWNAVEAVLDLLNTFAE